MLVPPEIKMVRCWRIAPEDTQIGSSSGLGIFGAFILEGPLSYASNGKSKRYDDEWPSPNACGWTGDHKTEPWPHQAK